MEEAGQYSHLLSTVCEGKLDEVRTLISSCNLSKAEEYACICSAVEKDHTEIVQLLLQNNFEFVNERKECYPLISAAENGNVEVTKILLDKGADINNFSPYSDTPLFCAVRANKEEVVKLLLSRGANVHAEYRRMSLTLTGIGVAVRNANFNIIEELLKHGADANSRARRKRGDVFRDGPAPLWWPVRENRKELVELLLKYGADPNAKGAYFDRSSTSSAVDKNSYLRRWNIDCTPLHTALTFMNEEITLPLLQHGSNADDKDFCCGRTALQIAVEKGRPGVVEQVLKYHRPSVSNARNKSALVFAAIGGRKEIVSQLLQYGFNFGPEDSTNTALLYGTVKTNQLEIVQKLLKFDADPNYCYIGAKHGGYSANFNPPTVLLLAIQNRSKAMIQLLVKFGADVNIPDKNYATGVKVTPLVSAVKDPQRIMKQFRDDSEPLIINSEKESLEIVQILLKNGADANLGSELEYRSTHKQIDYGSSAPLEEYCYLGGKLHLDTEVTALHMAVKNGLKTVVRALLENGAKVNLKTRRGLTPLHFAAKAGDEDICSTLLQFGASIEATDCWGRTAPLIAAENFHFEMARRLIYSLKTYSPTCYIHSALQQDTLNIFVSGVVKFLKERRSMDTTGRVSEMCIRKLFAFIHECVEPSIFAWSIDAPAPYVFRQFAIHMQAASLFPSTEDFEFKSSEPGSLFRIVASKDRLYFSSLRQSCEAEVVKMKNERVGGTDVSFYDILSADIDQLTWLARNEAIFEIMIGKDDSNLNENFPIYANYIDYQYLRGLVRNSLFEASVTYFHRYPSHFSVLPYGLAEKLLSYLSNNELRNLIAALVPVKQI